LTFWCCFFQVVGMYVKCHRHMKIGGMQTKDRYAVLERPAEWWRLHSIYA